MRTPDIGNVKDPTILCVSTLKGHVQSFDNILACLERLFVQQLLDSNRLSCMNIDTDDDVGGRDLVVKPDIL